MSRQLHFSRSRVAEAAHDRSQLLLRFEQAPGTLCYPARVPGSVPLANELEAVRAALCDLEGSKEFSKANLRDGLSRGFVDKRDRMMQGARDIESILLSSPSERLSPEWQADDLSKVTGFISVAADIVGLTYAWASADDLRALCHWANEDNKRLIKRITARAARGSDLADLGRALESARWHTSRTIKVRKIPTVRTHDRRVYGEEVNEVFYLRQITQAFIFKLGIADEPFVPLYEAIKQGLNKKQLIVASLVKSSDWLGEGHSRVSHRTARRYNIEGV